MFVDYYFQITTHFIFDENEKDWKCVHFCFYLPFFEENFSFPMENKGKFEYIYMYVYIYLYVYIYMYTFCAQEEAVACCLQSCSLQLFKYSYYM